MRIERRRTPRFEAHELREFASRMWVRTVGLGLVAFVVGYFFATTILFPPVGDPTDTPLVTIPELLGDDEASARERLTDAGLVPVVQARINDESAEPGTVIGQRPLAGQEARPGAEVALLLSDGVATAIVPDVTGLAANEAAAVLRWLGLDVELQREEPPSGTAGVRSVDPAPGTRMVLPATVGLVVNEGTQMVAVPDVRGRHVDDVESAILAAGLQLGAVRYRNDTPDAPGRVISQSPPPRSSVRAGAFVSIEVSGKGDDTATEVSIPPDSTGS